MLEVNGINTSYNGFKALWDVTLSVSSGECVAVVGANGAGKSTLLKTISGLLHPSSGTIEFKGRHIEKLPPHSILNIGISHIPEGRMLFPKMSVLENLELGAYLPNARSSKDETLANVFELFPILKERKGQRAETLSGGEQQMLAIGRGLMSKPSLLMFDEPSLGLAPKLVLRTFEIIQQVHSRGISVLLVEQNVRHAFEVAHRSYVMDTGRIVLEGQGKDLVDNEYVRKAYLAI